MSDKGVRAYSTCVYTVEYVDDRPEEVNFLGREGDVKISYPNGDSFEGSVGEAAAPSRARANTRGGRRATTTSVSFLIAIAADVDSVHVTALLADKPCHCRCHCTIPYLVKVVATYEGVYVDGVKQELGKMTFPNGDTYHGEWKQDKMHGDGSYMYANDDIFSGKFAQGIRAGKGTYEFAADKSLLVGNWADNITTDGKWIFKDGGSYVGRFEGGKPIGSCMFKFPSGLQQDGEFVKAQGGEADPRVVKTRRCTNLSMGRSSRSAR